jgi:SIR2-like domain
MLLRGLGVLRAVRSVVVLGAGASRGASFVQPGRQVLPPLDADFFRQAQQLDEAAYAEHARPVLEFIRDEYGIGSVPTLEALFTQLEGFDRFLRQFSSGPGRRTERYRRQLSYLQALIPAVFRAAFADDRCDWHGRIAKALRKGDAVISFNYDALIDDALRRYSAGIWDASCGYALNIAEGAQQWSAEKTPGPFTRDYIRLLKPHGSLHWTRLNTEREQLSLHGDPYAQRSARRNVIPPTWDKTILGDWPWKTVWREASRMLGQARCLIVIGYSVPATDLMSQALIRSSVGDANLRLLVVVNPDRAARAQVVSLARPAISGSTRIIEMETLADFASSLDETATEQLRRRRLELRLGRLDRRMKSLDSRLGDIEDWEDRLDELEQLEARVEALED